MYGILATAALAALLPEFASASCGHGTHLVPRGTVNTFSYDDVSGPLNWYGLDPSKNSLCAKGTNQSPQVIKTDANSQAKRHQFKFALDDAPDGVLFENLGTTVEAHPTGSMTHAGTTYNLVQYHFHTPSEHRLDDISYPMEMHMVFQNPDSKAISVLGFMADLCTTPGCTFPLLSSTFENIAQIATPGNETETGALAFGALTKHFLRNKIYKYAGSLTTPPCAEGVSWFVSAEPLPISAEDFKAVRAVTKFNSRYTQNLPGAKNLEDLIREELDANDEL